MGAACISETSAKLPTSTHCACPTAESTSTVFFFRVVVSTQLFRPLFHYVCVLLIYSSRA
jgi:hypothetical protein